MGVLDATGTSRGGLTDMIYILAVFLPPLALLLNGQIFSAILNAFFFVVFLVLGLLFFSPWLWLIAPAYAVIAIYMTREDRKHRELVDAIRKHGTPPGWKAD